MGHLSSMFRITLTVLTLIYLADSYRLPKDVRPQNYKLRIVTYLGEKDNFDFDGEVWIKTSCVSPTSNITLHSKDLKIKDNEITLKDVTSKASRELKNLKVVEDKVHDFLIILVNEPLKEDHQYEIYIPFKGKLDDGLAGFYRSNYIDSKTKEKRWLGVTQFEATSARRAFPCFDEPEMKATFDVRIGRKDGYRAISNMPLLETTPVKEKEGWYWDVFDTSVPMSTYLLAFIVSDFDFKKADDSHNNVTFRIWARKDALNQVEFAKDVGPKALEFYEKFFGIDYPLPKQDMVAIPDFSSGAMENWGLITYREAYLLYDPQVSSKSSQHSVASVIAHELAHQWFGNLVTMKWWTDLWLNEGFATYMASVCVDALFPEWNSLEAESADNVLAVFSFDALRTSHPVSVPIGDPKEIDEIFDTISYKKGSSLIRMMTMFLGEEVLRKGVSNYLREHRYQNAEQDDLWKSLTDEAHKSKALPADLSVKSIMDTWTLRTGYPVISVVRDYEKKTAKISQTRFLRDLVHIEDDTKACWWVPLSFATKNHQDFNLTTPKEWLSCPKKDQTIENIAEKDEWVVFNSKMAGIYKVNYDDANWRLIVQAMQSEDFNRIPVLNRVQLLSDTGDLAFIGSLKYEIFFDLTKYLTRENEYLPWRAALAKTAGLNVALNKSPSYGYFKEFMRMLLAPAYKMVGGLVVSAENSNKLDAIKLQSLVVGQACKFEVEECLSDSSKAFDAWMASKGHENRIPKDLRGAVYCVGLRKGSEAEWDFLWSQYLKSNVATEKNTMLNALGCTSEIWLLKRYLEWSLDESKIRRQDCGTVFGAVARNVLGHYVAKEFFYNNIDRITKHLSPNSRRLSRYLSSIAADISEVKHKEEFEEFIEKNKENFADVKQGVEQSLETVKINVQWQEKHADEVKLILEKFSVSKEKK